MTYTTSQAGINVTTSHTTVKAYSTIDSMQTETTDEAGEQSIIIYQVDVNTDYTK